MCFNFVNKSHKKTKQTKKKCVFVSQYSDLVTLIVYLGIKKKKYKFLKYWEK